MQVLMLLGKPIVGHLGHRGWVMIKCSKCCKCDKKLHREKEGQITPLEYLKW